MTIPDTLRKCADAPYAPKGDYQQDKAAKYTTALGGAYLDCKTKHGAIIRIIDETNAKAQAAAKSASK